MKGINLPIMLGVLSLLASCSDDNILFNEPQAIRAYETDARIMAQFVEVDKSTGISGMTVIGAGNISVSISR